MKYNIIQQILSEIKKSTHNSSKISVLKYNVNNFLTLKQFKIKISLLRILYLEGYINGYKYLYFYKKNNSKIELINILLIKKLLNNFNYSYNYYLNFFFIDLIFKNLNIKQKFVE
jgi:ribosomal protein S8